MVGPMQNVWLPIQYLESTKFSSFMDAPPSPIYSSLGAVVQVPSRISILSGPETFFLYELVPAEREENRRRKTPPWRRSGSALL